MFDFVPVAQYTHYFDIAVLVLLLIAVWQCHKGIIFKQDTVEMNANWGAVVAILLILYMGLRPVSGLFGDTINYARGFYEVQRSGKPFSFSLGGGDWLFYNMQDFFAVYSDIHSFFLLCAAIYVGSLWMAMRRIFRNYNYVPFLVVIMMFTFWTYGVNGIRNGMGASLFILAVSYINTPWVAAVICFLAVGVHKSVLLMVAASALTWFVKNSYYYLSAWVMSVLVSYLLGGRIQAYLSTLNVLSGDDRFSGYLTGSNMVGEVVQMSMVFRWDFLLYSSIAVAVGYYFIFRRNFKDEYYHWLFNTYLVCNAFWILIIRAAYSNRFAQISWFIMPIVLIYPFMKQRFWQHHEKMLGYALLLFYAFTFYSNILK